MAGETVGFVTCPFSLERSPVKRNKNGKLYYSNAASGPVIAHGQAYQDWIEDNLEPVETPDNLDPVPDPGPDPEPEPDAETAAKAIGPEAAQDKRVRPWLIYEKD